MAKKKNKNRDFSKLKETVAKFLKISAKVLIATIVIAIAVAFIAIPFLHNKMNDVVAKCIWYSSCLLFVTSAIATAFKKPKTPSKYPLLDFLGNLGLVPIVVLFGSAFLINYYDTAYTWWWAVFVLILLYIPVFTFGMRNFLKKEKEYTEDQLKASLKSCWKYVCFYWLIDLFYMAIFNYWIANEQLKTIWLTMQFIFGGLAMVYIFYNLTRAFLSNTKKHWWGLLQDFLWGVAITVYLIFLIPNDSLQTIVLSITAAVYGGLLTLVGVAWTIKDNSEKLKQERKLSIKPYLEVHHRFLTQISEIPTDVSNFVTIGDIISMRRNLPDEISNSSASQEVSNGFVNSIRPSQYLLHHGLIYIEIENCGAGNAINFKLKYNDAPISTTSVTTNNPQKILLILKDELFKGAEDEYIGIDLLFEYTNVSSLGKYEQKEQIMFGRNQEGNLYISQFGEDMLTSPKEII